MNTKKYWIAVGLMCVSAFAGGMLANRLSINQTTYGADVYTPSDGYSPIIAQPDLNVIGTPPSQSYRQPAQQTATTTERYPNSTVSAKANEFKFTDESGQVRCTLRLAHQTPNSRTGQNPKLELVDNDGHVLWTAPQEVAIYPINR